MAGNAGTLTILIKSDTAQLSKDLSGIKKKIDTAFDFEVLKHGYEGLKKVGEGVKGVIESLTELAAEGEQLKGIGDAFNSLGGKTGVIDEAQKRIKNLVDTFDLMQIANKGLIAQVPGFQKSFGGIADLGARMSKALGTDAKTAISDLTDALIKGRAKGLLPYGFTFTDTTNRALVMKQALEQIPGLLSNLPEIADSVTIAFQGFKVALHDIKEEVAIQLNSNPALIEAFHNIQEAVTGVDSGTLATDLANISAFFINIAASAIPPVVEGLHNFRIGLEQIMTFVKNLEAEFVQSFHNIEVSIYEAIPGRETISRMGEGILSLYDKLNTKLISVRGNLGGTGNELREAVSLPGLAAAASPAFAGIGKMLGDMWTKSGIEAVINVAKVQEEKGVEANKKTADNLRKLYSAGLVDGVDKAANEAKKKLLEIQTQLDQLNADTLKRKFEEALNDGNLQAAAGFLAEYKNAVDALAADYEAKMKLAGKTLTAEQLQEYRDKFIIPATRELQERQKKAFNESVSFFSDLLTSSITGSAQSIAQILEDALKRVAVGFASQILASIATANGLDLTGVTGAGGLGQSLAASLGFGGGGVKGIQELLGLGGSAANIGPVVDGAAYAESLTKATAATQASTSAMGTLTAALPYAGVALTAAAVGYNTFDKFSNFNKRTDTGKAVGVATTAIDTIFPGIGTAIDQGLKALGLSLQKTFTKNQSALLGFEKYVEETLKKSLGKALDFAVKDINQFDNGDWADKFWKDFGDKGAGTFDALGKSFEKLLGLENGSGQQLGALLAQNLAGDDLNASLDNIKLFLDSMNVSVEDLRKALLDSAKAGEITWQEFDIMRQKLDQIPESGLAGLGDIAGAFDQIRLSGGRGIQAINGLKNIAIEAKEAGVNSFEALRDRLNALGYSAQEVDAFFTALGQRGITTIDQFGSASDDVLGGVIADMQTLGVNFQSIAEAAGLDETTTGFKNLADQIKDVGKSINDLPDKVRVKTELVDTTGAAPNATGNIFGFSSGGVISQKSLFSAPGGYLGSIAENGPESIMPLKRKNGMLGVMNFGGNGSGPKIQLTVNAPYAQAGAAQEIMTAFGTMRAQIMRDVTDAVSRNSRRGVY